MLLFMSYVFVLKFLGILPLKTQTDNPFQSSTCVHLLRDTCVRGHATVCTL